MKTLNITLIILAMAIQGMVYGQTQENQATKTKVHKSSTKFYPVLGKEFGISYSESKANKPAKAFESPYNKSLNIKGTLKDATELTAQASEMQELESALRNKLGKASDLEKKDILKQIEELSQQTEYVQIQSSEIKGKVNKDLYEFNKDIFLSLANDPNVNDNFVEYAGQLYSEADKTFKMAIEMRQEAYAMPNSASKLGSLINAEEKEHIAISKQKEAINILNKVSTPVMANN